MTGAQRVAVTPEAAQMLRRLRADHGPLMFHQSGGCCDGSSPMCFPVGEFVTGDVDVHLGDLQVGDPEAGDPEAVGGELVPFWISKAQYVYWSHTHLTVDIVPGRGAGFSVEAPTGHRFLIRSRLFTDAEAAELA
jgi:uncharacterized protein (DUF779 family)